MFRVNPFILLTGAIAIVPLWAQRPEARIAGSVNGGELQILRGNVHPLARAEFDQGTAPADLPMEHMLLVLTRTPAQEAALQTLLREQQDSTSAQYHHWLTPQEFGSRFGAADADIQTITSWLQSQGFTVNSVSNGRTIIDFTGTAGQVQQAFHTQIHRYVVHGQEHWANATNPQIPAGLTPVVAGVATLHNFTKQSQLISSGRQFEAQLSSAGRPLFTAGFGNNALSPGDYARIYNLNPLFNANVNGAGTTIAVVGRTNINLSDIQEFRSTFGLSGGTVQVIVNGRDPGDVGGSEEAEAVLDTSWAGATAPGATVDLVVSKTTNTADGVDLSELYIIDQNLADVMTESFGDCEAHYMQAEANYYSSLAEQAASQGITYFVAAGDAGSAGCNSGSDNTSDGIPSVNILASNPFVVAVGGTEFNENGNYATYWSSSNGPYDVSAQSYIPEDVWNESCTISTGVNPCTNGNSPGLWAGGGGASTLYSKPSWQSGVTGIPNDGVRDVPDVSLTAAGHDPYLLCLDGSCTANSRGRIHFQGYSGTSAATPSMAGITATILQLIGGRLGPINSSLYQLAAAEALSSCNASNTGALPASNCVFNDVTVGNNSVPGEAGYNTVSGTYQATVGYDLASGLGSINAANLASGLTGGGLGTPVLNVSPTTLNFGTADLGVPGAQQVTISNTGNGNLLITQISVAEANFATPEYSTSLACGNIILPNKSCTLTVTFTPRVTGTHSATLTLETNASTTAVSLSGTGVATSTALISNTSLNFGTQKVVSRSTIQSITITNSTLQTLYAGNISVGGANAEDFVTGNNCGTTIASGTSCSIFVIFSPLFAGSRSASLNVPVSGTGAQTAISLSGAGTLNGSFEIVSVHTGKVLEVAGASSGNGVSIQQNALNGFEQQQWQFVPTGDGYYFIQNILTGKVLDVTGGYTTGGTLMQQWQELGGANQQWRLVPVDDVHYAIINRNSGLALDVVNGSTANGAQIQQWSFLGDPQQLWVLVPTGSYNIANNLSSYVLDVPGGSTSDGTLIQQWSLNGYRQQQWQLIPVGGGYYAIMNRSTGKVLDVYGGSVNGGALIQQWDYVGGENQQWQVVPTDATNYKIVNRLSGAVLDDTNSSLTAGTFIQQWGFVGDKNQQWQLNPVVYYNIVNRNSGLVLDVVNGSMSAGAMIQQWPSNGFEQQQWQLVLVSNGYYAIMNNLTSLVLDVANSSTADGALIEQNNYVAAPSQQWQLTPISGGGYYEIQNLNSTKAFDMTGGYLYGGALLQQWDYLAGTNQQWQLLQVPL